MRHGCPALLTVAILAMGPTSPEAAIGDDTATVTIIASPSLIPVGTPCEITLNPVPNGRETVEITHQGTIVRTSDAEIVLEVTQTRRTATANSRLAKLPLANRLFRNIGIGTPKPGEPQIVPIPLENIQSVRCLSLPTPAD